MTTTTPTTPARRRPSTWLALGLLAVALGMVAFMFAVAALPGHERLSGGFEEGALELVTIMPSLAAFLMLPIVGAILAIQRPRNPVGWILLVGGMSLILGDFTIAYVEHSIVLRSELPGYRLLGWASPAFATIAFPLLAIWLPLLYPDGRLPSHHWRAVGWIAAANLVTAVVVALVLPVDGELGRLLPNPSVWNSDIPDIINGVTSAVSGGLIVAAIVAVAVRFRRSHGVERQQMKWFLAAVTTLALAILVLAILQDGLAWAVVMLALAFLPVAIGIAVLRYRLYEIDRLISRTIGWGLVTALSVGTFAVLVLGSSAVLEPLTGGNTLAVAGATLVVVALFAPLRSRVQRAVDRRFDRARYDGERLVGAFGERLRDEVDLETIRTDVLGTVDAAVRPASMGLWLRERPRAGR